MNESRKARIAARRDRELKHAKELETYRAANTLGWTRVRLDQISYEKLFSSEPQ